MVAFFNRRKLMMDVSPEEVAKTKGILEENGVEYRIVTKRSSDIMGDAMHADMAVGRGMSYSAMKGKVSYTYMIFVRRKDYDKAVKICHFGK